MVAAMKHMVANFSKLDKFKGVDFKRWQKKMHFLLSTMSVLYIPPFYGFASPNGEAPMFPIIYPMLVLGLFPPQPTDQGAGLYVVPTFPNSFKGPIDGYPSNAIISFTYNVPIQVQEEQEKNEEITKKSSFIQVRRIPHQEQAGETLQEQKNQSLKLPSPKIMLKSSYIKE
ncbi:hypothetical protein Tco_0741205 [Tanacetum coccineum]